MNLSFFAILSILQDYFAVVFARARIFSPCTTVYASLPADTYAETLPLARRKSLRTLAEKILMCAPKSLSKIWLKPPFAQKPPDLFIKK
jgi:hypothetical protein